MPADRGVDFLEVIGLEEFGRLLSQFREAVLASRRNP